MKRAEVVIDGHALSSCLDGGAGETLAHVYVSGRSKGVAERMVEVITPERLELGHVLILGAWKDGRVVADPCLTPARPKTPGRPYDEKVEIEVEMVMSRHYHERRNALGSLPTDPPAEEVAWPKGPDGRSIPTACGGLTNEIFEGTPGSPGGTVEFAARSPVPKTHGRGCGSCAATSSNGAGGGAALLLTFIVLAASRRLRGEN